MAVNDQTAGDAPSAETLLERLTYPFRRPAPPPARAAMGFFTDTTLCIGCKACEVACKQWNQLPADGFSLSGQSYDNTLALGATTWRHVAFVEQFPSPPGIDARQTVPGGSLLSEMLAPKSGRWLMMSDVCKHCSTAPCQLACPTGAIVYNEFADVYIQNDICNGCGYCVAACPFGVITRSTFDGHAHKCTLCYDRQRDDLTPACAKACPTGSIQFGSIEELKKNATKRVAELHQRGQTDAHLYGDAPTQHYPALHAFFLLLDKPSLYGLPDEPQLPQSHLSADFIRAFAGCLATLLIAFFAMRLYG